LETGAQQPGGEQVEAEAQENARQPERDADYPPALEIGLRSRRELVAKTLVLPSAQSPKLRSLLQARSPHNPAIALDPPL
jgi:hypothetical protein